MPLSICLRITCPIKELSTDITYKVPDASTPISNTDKPKVTRRAFHKFRTRFHVPTPTRVLLINATNERAIGAATCWQGYSIRLGFGTTRIKNQTKAANPNRGKHIFNTTFFLLMPTIRPLLGQVLKNHFFILFFILYRLYVHNYTDNL